MGSEPLFKSLIDFSIWGKLIYLKGFKKDSSCGEADYSDVIAAQLCNIASLAISAVTLRHGDMVTYCRRGANFCIMQNRNFGEGGRGGDKIFQLRVHAEVTQGQATGSIPIERASTSAATYAATPTPAESSRENIETTKGPSLSNQSIASTAKEEDYPDQPQSPPRAPENLSPPEALISLLFSLSLHNPVLLLNIEAPSHDDAEKLGLAVPAAVKEFPALDSSVLGSLLNLMETREDYSTISRYQKRISGLSVNSTSAESVLEIPRQSRKQVKGRPSKKEGGQVLTQRRGVPKKDQGIPDKQYVADLKSARPPSIFLKRSLTPSSSTYVWTGRPSFAWPT
ncbi:hypothetical protein CK203_056496 [Vitis vinifera]|uniref:Uncharacterized protein n=1 Tax=Vitis vinifera TaxID=29760 RepID=A0A438GEK8_VITVI|nr:hypothetical protein CK203_056496 [Vitis vinifera]